MLELVGGIVGARCRQREGVGTELIERGEVRG